MNELLSEITKAKSVGITGHVRPDGDCAGSTTAMYNYIADNYPDKEVYFFLEPVSTAIENCLDFPERSEAGAFEGVTLDLFISLDSSSEDRLGDNLPVFKSAKKRVVIDHHKTNTGFGDVNIVRPEVSSACEVLFELLETEKIGASVARSLYLGIVHDTGVFKYQSTTGRTMTIAGILLDKGVDSAAVIDGTFYERTWNQNRLLGRAIEKTKIFANGMISLVVISAEDLAEFGCTRIDTDGIVENIRLIKGVEIAVFIREDGENYYKVSLRSKTGMIDVSEISAENGGGGHKMAAGFSVYKNADELTDYLVDTITRKLNEGLNGRND